MARLYANENLPEPVVVELRRLGHDVVTMRESGHAGRAVPDTEVLEFATMNRHVHGWANDAAIVPTTFRCCASVSSA